MQDYRDLKLIASRNELEQLIKTIETNLRDGWTRARDKEVEIKENYFIFTNPRTNSKPKSDLYLKFDSNDYLYVCNIIFLEDVKSNIGQYNSILEDFLTKFIEPIANSSCIEIITTPAERTIDNSMSPELSEVLKRFSRLANKSSGGTHPYDEKRFFDFIIQAHNEKSLLDESTFEGLLIDEEWPNDYAFELACKYRFGRDLLQKFQSSLGEY